MGKVFQISIYSLLLILGFLLFGSMLKSCGSKAVDNITDTASEVAQNIEQAGGEVLARAENAVENVADEFEGDDIDFSATDDEKRTFSQDEDESDAPSYVQEDAPVYNPPEDVKPAQPKKEEVKEKPAKKTTSASSGSGGKYLLITGNYSQESNAKAMVKKLKNLGYNRAESIIFDGSKFYTVIAGKYQSMNSANAAMGDLGGIDAYVQKRRD